MKYKAKLSNLHIAPRKVRLVVNLVRGKDVRTAQRQLEFLSKRASYPVLKLLNSAIGNAKNVNSEVNEDGLFIQKVFVDEGPKFKRFRPVADRKSTRLNSSHSSI